MPLSTGSLHPPKGWRTSARSLADYSGIAIPIPQMTSRSRAPRPSGTRTRVRIRPARRAGISLAQGMRLVGKQKLSVRLPRRARAAEVRFHSSRWRAEHPSDAPIAPSSRDAAAILAERLLIAGTQSTKLFPPIMLGGTDAGRAA